MQPISWISEESPWQRTRETELPVLFYRRGISVCDQSSRKHTGTHIPADSVRRAPRNNVMEARKVNCIAIGGWVTTLCLLSADIGS